MANDSQSGCKIKDDNNKDLVNGNNTGGLRRSTRESSSSSSSRKQTTSTPSTNSRKLEQVTKKSEIVENQATPSPLRRSDRGKKQSSSSSPGSKKSVNAISDSKNRMADVVESVEVDECQLAVVNKRKRMDGRSYKALFTSQRRRITASVDDGDDKDVEQQNKLSEIEISRGGIGAEEVALNRLNSSLRNSSKETKMHNVEHILPVSSGKHNEPSYRDGVELSKNDIEKSTLNVDLVETCFKMQRGEPNAAVATGLDEKCESFLQGNKTPSECQMNVNETTCIICKFGGKLICCNGKGCKRSYHISCLNPHLQDPPIEIWHCNQCVMKKIEKGVCSVSGGVESIWDFREVDVSDVSGCRKQKQYFVKYEGLAHLHNKWIPESQLLLEAPLLVTHYKLNDKAVMWNADWTVPHRLLKKRPIMLLEKQNQHLGAETSSCHYEWLVKWCGLDYEDCTWELEDASFLEVLQSTHGQKLIKGYEDRLQRALEAPIYFDKSKVDPLVKLSELPAWGRYGTDDTNLSTIKKLREYWYKGQNAVVFDERERALKIILYILAMSDVFQPFLVITTSNTLSHWVSEFSRLAPSIDILVYSGNKDTRKGIRTLEFYEKGNLIMFQVLLSSMETVIEDLHMLQSLKWESIIVDECQSPKISRHFEQIKTLSTDSKVLIFSAPIKEAITEYQNLISFLDPCVNSANNNVSRTECDDTLGKLKEMVNDYIAYECKFSKFVEYWLPVRLSNLQLEQYCSILLSSSIALCSCSKNDVVGALRETLISSRKCCDHPYLLDPHIQSSLTKDLQPIEYLDIGIKASGKLQLLDLILLELKNRRCRVVIYFQCISGSGRDSVGDILDDFVRQRFGPDSYERVDACVKTTKKHEALNNFNNKDSSRFVFLLENRACHQSIKLSSVDAIVIFNSDTIPSNDLRALQKICIDSLQFDQIKIFRLYSSFTVEEKSLTLAKRNHTFDSNDSKRGPSDTLLMWGASYLFASLDEFYRSNIADISSEPLVLNTVVKELVGLLSLNNASNETTNNPMIVKVQHLMNGGYSTSLSLHGELKIRMMDGNPSHLFWSKLLEGRNYRWKFLHVQNQRQRKRVKHFSELLEKQDAEDEVSKKRKKVVSQARPVLEASKLSLSDKRSHPELPKSPQLQPKPDLSRLCGILKLADNVKLMVGMFLDYVVENHHVSREPESIYQAFQISMCWIGASLLKHKIDRKESLALAKEHLQFICKEEEAESVYSKLKLLRKDFYLKDPKKFCEEANSKQPVNEQVSQSQVSIPKDMRSELVERSDMVVPELVKAVKRICEKRMAKLVKKQHHEVQEFHKTWDDKMLDLENKNKVEASLVRILHSCNNPTMLNKLRGLEEELKSKREVHEQEKATCLKDLEAKHLQERNDEKEKAGIWVAKAEVSANGAADNVEEIPPPGTTESVLLQVPKAVLLEPGDSEPIETWNVSAELNGNTDKNNVANTSNNGNSPSFIELHSVQPIISVTPEGLSQDKDSRDRSQPLDSIEIHDGSAAPAEANHSSVPADESQPSRNVDAEPISQPEQVIFQRVETDASPELESPQNVTQIIANVTPPCGPTPSQSLAANVARNEPSSGPSPQLQSRPQTNVQVTRRPLSADPLRNELESIRRDTEQTIRSHEVMKLKLKSDCEKETQAMIAQIRRKYETKLEDVEVAFVGKIKELRDKEYKVSKQRELAWVYSSKSLNVASSTTTLRQAGPSSFMQQLRHFSIPSAPQVSAGPSIPLSSAVSSFSMGSPAANRVTAPSAPRSSLFNGSSLVPHPATQLAAPSAPRSALVSGPLLRPPAATQSAVLPAPQKSVVSGPLVRPPASMQLAVPSALRSSAQAPAATQSTFPSAQRGMEANSSPADPSQLRIPSSPRVLGVSGSSVDLPAATSHLADVPTPRVSGVTGSSAGLALATRQIPVPPLQIVNQPAALFSCPITPSANNRLVGGEIRGPPPHLQLFRPPPASASDVATLIRTMPGPLNPNTTYRSTSLSHPTPEQPPSPQVVLPPPQPPLVPPLTTQPPLPPQVETHNSTVSELELLMNMETRPSVYPLDNLPPLPDFDAPLDLSEFGPPFATQISSNPPTLATDSLVCLSDED